MASTEQFTQTVNALINNATPNRDPTPPPTPQQPTASALSSPNPSTRNVEARQRANYISISAQSTKPNADNLARVKRVIFDTNQNAFYCRTFDADRSQDPFVSRCCIPIPKFATKICLGNAGITVGEGQVDRLWRVLPKRVVALRIIGLYRELVVVRRMKDVEGQEALMDGGVNTDIIAKIEEGATVVSWDAGLRTMSRQL